MFEENDGSVGTTNVDLDISASSDSPHSAVGAVEADETWLLAPSREYPVLVDPTLAIDQPLEEGAVEGSSQEPVNDLTQRDCYIRSNDRDLNDCAGALRVGLGNSGGKYRALLHFGALPSIITKHMKIASARLRMYAQAKTTGGTIKADVHRLKEERNVWNGCVTWEHRSVNNSRCNWTGAWADPGGSFVSGAADFTSFSTVPGYKEWTVTGPVQAWVDGAPNNGLIVKSSAEATEQVIDFADNTASPKEHKPHLLITYHQPEVGVQFHEWDFDGTSEVTDRRTVISKMKEAGLKWLRVDAAWAELENDGPPTTAELTPAGGYDPATSSTVRRLNETFDYATSNDPAIPGDDSMKVLAQLWWTPCWARPVGDSCSNGATLGERNAASKTRMPANASTYGDFVFRFARTFGDRVDAYEIWNEPDLPGFFNPVSSGYAHGASEYLKLLRAAFPEANAGDTVGSDLVLTGGPSHNDIDWVDQLYDQGGDTAATDTSNFFDVMATHAYMVNSDNKPECPGPSTATKDDFTIAAVQNIDSRMGAEGDGGKPIWFTEFGWFERQTKAPVDPTEFWNYGVDQAAQADYAVRALKFISNFPVVDNVFWYTSHKREVDPLPSNPTPDQREEHERDLRLAGFGLLERDATYSATPAYTKLKNYLLGNDVSVGTGGRCLYQEVP